jgi:hypothetical protein
MVTRSGSARLGLANLIGPSRRVYNSGDGQSLRQVGEDGLLVNLEVLDYAIGQLASGLRVLLSLGLHSIGDNLNLRSYDMGTDASKTNGNDRYDVLVVEKYEDDAGTEKSNWTRVGVAFSHKDGNGLNVELRAIPVSGKLVIRRHEGKARTAEN